MMLKVVSLFSGAGGLDLGFTQSGFEICVAVESDPSCCATLRQNRPELNIIQMPLEDVPSSEILAVAKLRPLEAALVIGGPPCQPFSLAGHRKGLDDPRGKLLKEFVRVVRDVLPVGFVMENVRGLENWDNGRAMEFVCEELRMPIVFQNKSYQYTVTHDILNACMFGAPQFRERVFIVGNRLGEKFSFPEVTHAPIEAAYLLGKKPYVTVGEAIGGLGPADEPSDVAKRVSRTIKGRIARHGY